MATLILSYPGREFQGAPAYEAMGQWLALCDHITRAGGHILILDDLTPDAVYAASLGAPFLTAAGTPNRPVFLRARGDVAPAWQGEDPVGRALVQAGLEVRQAAHRFCGQLDVIALDRNRYILTHGAGPTASSRESLEEVKALLPLGAQTLEVELRPPFTAGGQGIAYLTAMGGGKMLLVHRGALLSHTPEDLIRLAGSQVEYFVLSPDDAEAGVCGALLVRGSVILPAGSSTILRGQLARRGFQLLQCDVSRLLAGKKGGPRALASDLPGLVLAEDSPSYAVRREELLQRQKSYR
jgi:hypothetical protein